MNTSSFPSIFKELIKTIVVSPSQNFEYFGQIIVNAHQLFKFLSIIYTVGGPIIVSRTSYIDFQLGRNILINKSYFNHSCGLIL